VNAYAEAEKAERRACALLLSVAGIVLALVIAVLVAGCGGAYPLEPAPDAGATQGDAAPAGTVDVGAPDLGRGPTCAPYPVGVCARLCQNLAGGLTCVTGAGVALDCARCTP